jgi:hypothetical protein
MRFLRELDRRRRISVVEDRRPSLMEMATCIRSIQCFSISFQSITLRPLSPRHRRRSRRSPRDHSARSTLPPCPAQHARALTSLVPGNYGCASQFRSATSCFSSSYGGRPPGSDGGQEEQPTRPWLAPQRKASGTRGVREDGVEPPQPKRPVYSRVGSPGAQLAHGGSWSYSGPSRTRTCNRPGSVDRRSIPLSYKARK